MLVSLTKNLGIDESKARSYHLTKINTKPRGSSPYPIAALARAILFSAKSERFGREPWHLELSGSDAQSSKREDGKASDLTHLVQNRCC